MHIKLLLAVTIFSAATTASFAQTVAARPATSLRTDNKRIRQGVKSGELTKAETVRLKSQQAAVYQEQKAYKADGVVTPAERKDLRQDKRKLSRNIKRQKNDAQTQP
ncbi:hypothetical protein ACFOWM_08185 [Ferruginibacter yonginensis]|uniref:DUF4148 domain-containing protein n=1 Tax=Ferruginibacter yonginensis TaxID=1310416 RepID=A0ABV8QRB6_9BACT